MGAPLWIRGRPPRPPLSGEVRADLCVVGLGGSGLAAARAGLARGWSVVGLDAGPVAGAAAGRNGGFLLTGGAEFYPGLVERIGRAAARDLFARTAAQIARLAAAHPGTVERRGSFRRPEDPEEAEACRRQVRLLNEDGFGAELRTIGGVTGAFVPEDATFDPWATAVREAAEVEAAGASLFEGSPAVHVEPGDVRTSAGRVRADRVAVCVDGGLDRLLPELSGRVRTLRLQMLATEPAADVKIPCAIYSRWGFEYWQQRPDGRVALGGGRDGDPGAEGAAEASTSDDVQAFMERVLRETIGTRAAVTHRWAGLVAYTQDTLPILDLLRPGLAVAGAYSGHGNVLGRLAGAEAVGALAGERFTLPRG